MLLVGGALRGCTQGLHGWGALRGYTAGGYTLCFCALREKQPCCMGTAPVPPLPFAGVCLVPQAQRDIHGFHKRANVVAHTAVMTKRFLFGGGVAG